MSATTAPNLNNDQIELSCYLIPSFEICNDELKTTELKKVTKTVPSTSLLQQLPSFLQKEWKISPERLNFILFNNNPLQDFSSVPTSISLQEIVPSSSVYLFSTPSVLNFNVNDSLEESNCCTRHYRTIKCCGGNKLSRLFLRCSLSCGQNEIYPSPTTYHPLKWPTVTDIFAYVPEHLRHELFVHVYILKQQQNSSGVDEEINISRVISLSNDDINLVVQRVREIVNDYKKQTLVENLCIMIDGCQVDDDLLEAKLESRNCPFVTIMRPTSNINFLRHTEHLRAYEMAIRFCIYSITFHKKYSYNIENFLNYFDRDKSFTLERRELEVAQLTLIELFEENYIKISYQHRVKLFKEHLIKLLDINLRGLSQELVVKLAKKYLVKLSETQLREVSTDQLPKLVQLLKEYAEQLSKRHLIDFFKQHLADLSTEQLINLSTEQLSELSKQQLIKLFKIHFTKLSTKISIESFKNRLSELFENHFIGLFTNHLMELSREELFDLSYKHVGELFEKNRLSTFKNRLIELSREQLLEFSKEELVELFNKYFLELYETRSLDLCKYFDQLSKEPFVELLKKHLIELSKKQVIEFAKKCGAKLLGNELVTSTKEELIELITKYFIELPNEQRPESAKKQYVKLYLKYLVELPKEQIIGLFRELLIELSETHLVELSKRKIAEFSYEQFIELFIENFRELLRNLDEKSNERIIKLFSKYLIRSHKKQLVKLFSSHLVTLPKKELVEFSKAQLFQLSETHDEEKEFCLTYCDLVISKSNNSTWNYDDCMLIFADTLVEYIRTRYLTSVISRVNENEDETEAELKKIYDELVPVYYQCLNETLATSLKIENENHGSSIPELIFKGVVKHSVKILLAPFVLLYTILHNAYLCCQQQQEEKHHNEQFNLICFCCSFCACYLPSRTIVRQSFMYLLCFSMLLVTFFNIYLYFECSIPPVFEKNEMEICWPLALTITTIIIFISYETSSKYRDTSKRKEVVKNSHAKAHMNLLEALSKPNEIVLIEDPITNTQIKKFVNEEQFHPILVQKSITESVKLTEPKQVCQYFISTALRFLALVGTLIIFCTTTALHAAIPTIYRHIQGDEVLFIAPWCINSIRTSYIVFSVIFYSLFIFMMISGIAHYVLILSVLKGLLSRTELIEQTDREMSYFLNLRESKNLEYFLSVFKLVTQNADPYNLYISAMTCALVIDGALVLTAILHVLAYGHSTGLLLIWCLIDIVILSIFIIIFVIIIILVNKLIMSDVIQRLRTLKKDMVTSTTVRENGRDAGEYLEAVIEQMQTAGSEYAVKLFGFFVIDKRLIFKILFTVASGIGSIILSFIKQQ